MAENCGNCRYQYALQMGAPMPGLSPVTVTVCRRNPPYASLIPQNIGGPVTVTYWAAVTDSDWCGQWKPSEGADIKPFHTVQGGHDAST